MLKNLASSMVKPWMAMSGLDVEGIDQSTSPDETSSKF